MEIPIKCACGGTNFIYEDFMKYQYIIKCECGTTIRIDVEEIRKVMENVAEKLDRHLSAEEMKIAINECLDRVDE